MPLNRTGSPARAAVALRVDAGDYLLPTLQAWPVPSRTGSSYVARRAGDRVVLSVDGRSVPVAADAVSARVLRGAAPPRVAIEGPDFREVPVLAVVGAIPGSDWLLVSKVDLAEVHADASQDVWIVAAIGLAAWLAVASALYAARNRRALQRVLAGEAERAEKTRALHVLDSIVAGSTDAIVGKTLEGVVVSWSAGAERLFGYRAEEALGHSVTMLIPPERLAEEDHILESVRAGRSVSAFETVRLHKDGRPIAVSLNISPIRDASGKVVGVSKHLARHDRAGPVRTLLGEQARPAAGSR